MSSGSSKAVITAATTATTVKAVSEPPHQKSINGTCYPQPSPKMKTGLRKVPPVQSLMTGLTNSDEWYWDDEYGYWVYIEPKRIRRRRRDLTNKMEKNWRLGMRRNWNTAKKAKMLAKITITRDNMSSVS